MLRRPRLTLDAASDTGVDDVNNETTDDTPTVHVALNGSGATAPAAGDVVKVYSGLTPVASHTCTAGDIAADTVALTTSDLGVRGLPLTATITDEAGNESDASNAVTVTVDQTDAAAPTLTLDAASDTGVDDVNNETTDDTPTVHVALNGSRRPTAPAAGDVVKVYSGLTLVASHTLTAGDIAADTVALTTSDLALTGFTR